MKDSSVICCDTCKSETSTYYNNNNDVQIGMLEFSENLRENNTAEIISEEENKDRKLLKTRPLSVLGLFSLYNLICFLFLLFH